VYMYPCVYTFARWCVCRTRACLLVDELMCVDMCVCVHARVSFCIFEGRVVHSRSHQGFLQSPPWFF